MADSNNCEHGSVRLVDGSEREGRVQLCYNGFWGSVASHQWGFREARMVCKQLQLPEFGK